MLAEIGAALSQAQSDVSIGAIVLASASPNFFSAGFDVREVFAYDRDAMTEFFGDFLGLVERVADFPKPVVAAIGGHCFAAGAILVLACDFRVMAAGKYGYALNEINLGLPLPEGIVRLVIAAAGNAAFAFSTIAWNAAGSVIARSDSTLRSTMTPDLFSPSINRL